jgi:leader peptidase (prepilin peptidase)/N-methyltransferase
MPEFSAPELMPWLIGGAALFGLVWGSFLNVCIFRVVRDLSVVKPRSFCPVCEASIAWYDNIPLLSYLWLRGKCRKCREPIGFRYPLVELLTAIVLALVVCRFGWTLQTLKWALFESLMMILFWTDLELQILPDEFTWTGIAAGGVFASITPLHSALLDWLLARWTERMRSAVDAGLGAVLLPLPLWAFATFYKRVRRLEMDPLGLGDVKLMCLIGVFFGIERAIPVFIWGTVTGALVGGIYVLLKGRTAWQQEIPFGTFLCGAAGIAALLG